MKAAWIPLTHNAGGNHIGLDFDSDTLGKAGQIIVFGVDEDTKHLAADTFEAFINDYVLWLEEHAEWNSEGEYLEGPGGFNIFW